MALTFTRMDTYVSGCLDGIAQEESSPIATTLIRDRQVTNGRRKSRALSTVSILDSYFASLGKQKMVEVEEVKPAAHHDDIKSTFEWKDDKALFTAVMDNLDLFDYLESTRKTGLNRVKEQSQSPPTTTTTTITKESQIKQTTREIKQLPREERKVQQSKKKPAEKNILSKQENEIKQSTKTSKSDESGLAKRMVNNEEKTVQRMLKQESKTKASSSEEKKVISSSKEKISIKPVLIEKALFGLIESKSSDGQTKKEEVIVNKTEKLVPNFSNPFNTKVIQTRQPSSTREWESTTQRITRSSRLHRRSSSVARKVESNGPISRWE